jgi:hypothetical protein
MTFAIIAVRNVILKDHHVSHPSVILGFAVVNLWIVFLAVLSYFGLKMRRFSKI